MLILNLNKSLIFYLKLSFKKNQDLHIFVFKNYPKTVFYSTPKMVILKNWVFGPQKYE
jgi:hypothetical protein